MGFVPTWPAVEACLSHGDDHTPGILSGIYAYMACARGMSLTGSLLQFRLPLCLHGRW